MKKHLDIKNNLNYNLDVSHRMMTNWIARKLSPHGVTIAQAQIIAVLYQYENISQEELSKHLHIARTAVRQTLQQLLEKGYVTKAPSLADKRIHYFSLTEKSRNLLPLFEELIAEINHRALGTLTEYERITFCGLLQKIRMICVEEFKNDKP